MWLDSDGTSSQSSFDIKDFANWILKIGDNQMEEYDNGKFQLHICKDLCIPQLDIFVSYLIWVISLSTTVILIYKTGPIAFFTSLYDTISSNL